MTISTINLSSLFADVKTALTAKGLLQTVHYESASKLVFTTTLFSKIIKLGKVHPVDTNSDIVTIWVGDSYTGGGTTDTISNEILITSGGTATSTFDFASGVIIVTSNTFSFCTMNATGQIQNHIFFKDSVGDGHCLIYYNNTASSNSLSNSVNIRLRDRLPIDFVRWGDTPIYNENGNVLMMDLKLRGVGGFILPVSITGVKVIAIPSPTTAPYEVFGNDVAISTGYYNGATRNSNSCRILIVDGVL